MLALWLENQRLSLRSDVPIPKPPEGESLVRVVRAGVCSTDIELTRGYYPFTGIPGHEFVGVVERGVKELLGCRVVGEINAVCGECSDCASGRSSHCSKRSVLGIAGRNGAFAEYLTLPHGNLHLVPETVSTDAATFTEPLAAALQIQEQVHVDDATRVLVVGDGRLGQLVAQTMALTGCDLLVLGNHRAKLAILEARGIDTGLSDSTNPVGFDVAVECTGNPEGFAVARDALRARGTLVMKSTYVGELALDAAAVVVNELTLVGSRCGPFKPALDLLESGRVDVAPLVSAHYSLADGLAAFEYVQKTDVLKILLDAETDPKQTLRPGN